MKYTKKQLEVLGRIPFSDATWGDSVSEISRNCGPALRVLEKEGLVSSVSIWGCGIAWKSTKAGDIVIIETFPDREKAYLTTRLTVLVKTFDAVDKQRAELLAELRVTEKKCEDISEQQTALIARLKHIRGANPPGQFNEEEETT